MVLKENVRCERMSYYGKDEKHLHRGVNGHTRRMGRKECERSAIIAKRRMPIQLRSYLAQVALCAKFGSTLRLRSNGIYRMISSGTEKIAEKAKLDQWSKPRGDGRARAPGSPSPSSPSERQLVHGPPGGYPNKRPAKIATTARQPETQRWLYGALSSPGVALPALSELSKDDCDALQPFLATTPK